MDNKQVCAWYIGCFETVENSDINSVDYHYPIPPSSS